MFGFDLLNLTPWLRQIHDADDLDFQEVLIDYVASLNDAHDYIAFLRSSARHSTERRHL